jgi:hypothetical protein
MKMKFFMVVVLVVLVDVLALVVGPSEK